MVAKSFAFCHFKNLIIPLSVYSENSAQFRLFVRIFFNFYLRLECEILELKYTIKNQADRIEKLEKNLVRPRSVSGLLSSEKEILFLYLEMIKIFKAT